MEINRRAAKAEAASLSLRAKPSPLLLGALYYAILFILNNLELRISGAGDYYDAYYSNLSAAIKAAGGSMMAAVSQPDFMERVLPPVPPMPGAPGSLLILLITVMTMIIGVGFTIFCIQTARGREAAVGNLFDGFSHFGRVLLLYVIEYVLIALWSLLLIVPGIIASYRYRQAIYLLLDHPEMSPLDCIRESKLLMIGHKWELFVWDISFIGWRILGAIPLVNIWVYPYTELTYVKYYDALGGGIPDADESSFSL